MINSGNNKYSELVRQAQLGHRESMDILSLHVQNKMYIYFHRNIKNRDISEDLLQETLLAMVRNISGLKEPDRFWPWIYRIAWNKTKQHFRNQQRRVMSPFSVLQEDIVLNPYQKDQTVLNLLIHKETLGHLCDAVGQLKQQYRDVVNLRCFEQLPYCDIGPLTHCSPQLARVIFHRARQFLKYQLAARAL
jgi:RNA polymerase sigma-70 factor, ECF subfamily